MSLCTQCRLALRQTTRPLWQAQRRNLSTPTPAKSSTISELLATPTWSVRSLISPPSDPDALSSSSETVTPSQLHHLLRLSALPLPKSKAEEESMIATLESQLHFVRAIQRIDTTGVEPLRAIRDETNTARQEDTIGLEDLKEVLDKEITVGHYKRPRKVKEKVEYEAAEDWDALSAASRKAGRYFVVQSAKKGGSEG